MGDTDQYRILTGEYRTVTENSYELLKIIGHWVLITWAILSLIGGTNPFAPIGLLIALRINYKVNQIRRRCKKNESVIMDEYEDEDFDEKYDRQPTMKETGGEILGALTVFGYIALSLGAALTILMPFLLIFLTKDPPEPNGYNQLAAIGLLIALRINYKITQIRDGLKG